MASEWNRLIRSTCWLVLFFSAGLLVSSSTRPPYPIVDRAGVVVMRDDPGGSVQDHLKWFNRIARAHLPVRIEGYCNSACTFVLKMPARQVCVTPDVTLGFHLAFDTKTGNPMRAYTARLVKQVYPKPVQNWIHKHGPLKTDVIEMDAATAVRLGVVSAC